MQRLMSENAPVSTENLEVENGKSEGKLISTGKRWSPARRHSRSPYRDSGYSMRKFSRYNSASESEDDEESSNLQLAWEMLDLSKTILMKAESIEKARKESITMGETSGGLLKCLPRERGFQVSRIWDGSGTG